MANLITFITECLRECNDYSVEKKTYIAIEPINRFQEEFFHSILDCKEYLDQIQLSHIKMMVDSFHMNIENERILKYNKAIIIYDFERS